MGPSACPPVSGLCHSPRCLQGPPMLEQVPELPSLLRPNSISWVDGACCVVHSSMVDTSKFGAPFLAGCISNELSLQPAWASGGASADVHQGSPDIVGEEGAAGPLNVGSHGHSAPPLGCEGRSPWGPAGGSWSRHTTGPQTRSKLPGPLGHPPSGQTHERLKVRSQGRGPGSWPPNVLKHLSGTFLLDKH